MKTKSFRKVIEGFPREVYSIPDGRVYPVVYKNCDDQEYWGAVYDPWNGDQFSILHSSVLGVPQAEERGLPMERKEYDEARLEELKTLAS